MTAERKVPRFAWIGGGILVLAVIAYATLAAGARRADAPRLAVEAALRAEQAQQEIVSRLATRDKFERLNSESPLWEWWDFTLPGNPLRDAALAAMRELPRRQLQAETMLRDGFGLPVAELANLNLEPTPGLCQAARSFLRKHADSLRPTTTEPLAFALVAARISAYLPALDWLIARGCDSSEELAAYAVTANSYADSPERAQFLAQIAALRRR